MANTFKFGNKNWAWKEGSVLAYNDENNNFKPLPFDFTRSSSATRVNKDGLIEVVGSDEPRVDYLNNADGHLLLEPSRTNQITNSEVLTDSSWINQLGSTIDSGQVSELSGQNDAWKLNKASGTFKSLRFQKTLSSDNYTLTWFVKKGTISIVEFRFDGGLGANFIQFDLENGTSGTNPNLSNIEMTLFNGGWYRCSASINDSLTNVHLYIDDASENTGEGYIYAQYPQIEAGSYATSYIPTSGSSVTRATEDNMTQVNTNAWDISSSFSMYFSFDNNRKAGGSSPVLTVNTSGNTFQLYTNSSGNGGLNIYLDGQGGYIFGASGNDAMNADESKICITYNASTGRLAYFINGSLWNEQTSALSFGSLTNFVFSTAANTTLLSIKDNKLYTNALTDSEAIALTS